MKSKILLIMYHKWCSLVLLLVIASSNIECAENATDDSINDVQPWPALPSDGENDKSSNRRRPLTDPEHEHGDKTQASEGVYLDSADWSKEAEKWMFKGGEWGLVTLPDDDHHNIADPPVPGPVLLAEGDSMKKVIVSRSLSGLENVSLHFSYFLTHNPASPEPGLEVYQVQGNINSLVWPSQAEGSNVGYGQWSDGKVDILPFDGDFEIKFIGQRIIDENDIGLDDIVLRGTHVKNTVGDIILKSGENVTYTTSIVPQNESDTAINNTNGEIISTMSSENNNSIYETENEVSSNSSMVTESPNISNDTGTDVNNQSYTNAPENLTSSELLNNDTETMIAKTTAPSDNHTTLDTGTNVTEHILDNSFLPRDNISTQPDANITSSFNNATDGDNSTNIPQNNSTNIPQNNSTDTLQNNSTDIPQNNSTDIPQNNSTDIPQNNSTDIPQDNSTDIPQNNSTDIPQNNSTDIPQNNSTDIPQNNSTDIPQNNSTDISQNNSTDIPQDNSTDIPQNNSTDIPQNNSTDIPQNNSTDNPQNNSTTPLSNITNNASISVTGPGIGGTESPPVEEASWGVFKILLSIIVFAGCVLLFLYWRQRRIQDDEIPVFSRGPSHADYHNPTFHDDVSADEGLTGRGLPPSYKSFS